MKLLGWRASVAGVSIGVTCILSTALWAGGAGFGDDDDNSEDEGPSYFGFVKDTNGATVPDAKVTVGIKDRGGIVTRTDALGAYKVPGFGKDVDPRDVEIACDKQGYKQLRTLRRMRPPNADVKYPWELARCQHWVTLGQACRLTGDDRFAREIANELDDFVEANPVGLGINWTCTMDVGTRDGLVKTIRYNGDGGPCSDLESTLMER